MVHIASRFEGPPESSVPASSPAASPGVDELVARHLGLARSLARRFANRGEALDDLVQVAMVGLVSAAKRFDGELGIQFSTYATATIAGELKRHFRDKRWGLHVSRTAQERYLLVREATEWATEDLGRSPTISEIASRAGLTDEQVLEAHELAAAFHLDSIDANPGTDDSGPAIQVGGLDNGMTSVENRLTLDALVGALTEREQRLIELRFVEEMTQSQIAAHLGLSQMQVSRLLSRTLASLRHALS
jgi:RNA polymerase sigma-B factor